MNQTWLPSPKPGADVGASAEGMSVPDALVK